MSLHLFIVLAQHFKASLLENASENYFTTARAKGLTYSQSVRKHLVPNAVFPFVTLVGQTVPILITGAFVIEIIFNLPGMGRLTFDAINQRDWLLVQTVFMLSSAVLLLSNLIVDTIYFYLNPKLIDKITN
jgi:peptide/nickel transport system permease protein